MEVDDDMENIAVDLLLNCSNRVHSFESSTIVKSWKELSKWKTVKPMCKYLVPPSKRKAKRKSKDCSPFNSDGTKYTFDQINAFPYQHRLDKILHRSINVLSYNNMNSWRYIIDMRTYGYIEREDFEDLLQLKIFENSQHLLTQNLKSIDPSAPFSGAIPSYNVSRPLKNDNELGKTSNLKGLMTRAAEAYHHNFNEDKNLMKKVDLKTKTDTNRRLKDTKKETINTKRKTVNTKRKPLDGKSIEIKTLLLPPIDPYEAIPLKIVSSRSYPGASKVDNGIAQNNFNECKNKVAQRLMKSNLSPYNIEPGYTGFKGKLTIHDNLINKKISKCSSTNYKKGSIRKNTKFVPSLVGKVNDSGTNRVSPGSDQKLPSLNGRRIDFPALESNIP